MRVVELFAGVGGFRLGLERAGHTVVWANEWDRYAADIYDKNFGGQIDRRDITLVEASDIPAHDILCGGFPCQSFSVAGKRRGFEETRGTLFFDIIRIAKHHQTPFLFLENVKGLLNHDGGQTFEVILRTLDESGYDAQWQVLNSKNFGVPQNRERVIIIANLRNRPRRQVFPITSTEPENIEPVSDVEPGTKAIATRHLDRNGSLISDIAPTVQATETPHIISLIPGVSQDHRLYDVAGISPTLNPAAAVGGANVPKIGVINRDKFVEKEYSLTITASYHKGHDNHGSRPMVLSKDNGMGYNDSNAYATQTRPNKPLPELQQANGAGRNGEWATAINPTLPKAEVLQSQVHEQGLRGSLPDRQSKLDDGTLSSAAGIPAIPQTPVRAVQYPEANGDTPSQSRLAGQPPRESTGTLQRLPHEATPDREPQDGLSQASAQRSWAIRRLTPLETERLQGFPDNWTKLGVNTLGVEYAVSNTQRYKAMGNAVTTNVVEAVAWRLL